MSLPRIATNLPRSLSVKFKTLELAILEAFRIVSLLSNIARKTSELEKRVRNEMNDKSLKLGHLEHQTNNYLDNLLKNVCFKCI